MALDAGAGDHDVVAALGVVVVVAALPDDHVVAEDRVVLEPVAVVALEQVICLAALDPVVALVAEDGVGAVAGEHEVVARAGEGLRRVVAPTMKSWPQPPRMRSPPKPGPRP